MGHMDAMQSSGRGHSTPLWELAAARLRGYLAENRISHKEFGELVGWDRGKYQRRLAGEVALDLQDLGDIEQNTPITVSFLLTGYDEVPPRPPATRHVQARPQRKVAHLRPVGANPPAVDDDATAYVELAESRLGESNSRPIHYE